MHRIVDLCAEDRDEPFAVTIRQRLQHHCVDDGVYRRGGSDAGCEGGRGEECDSLVVPPRSPRLQTEHAGIMQRTAGNKHLQPTAVSAIMTPAATDTAYTRRRILSRKAKLRLMRCR
jgi:hypothetical protein